MTRVSPSEVEEIAEFEELTTSELQPFIDDAHLIVNNQVADRVDEGTATAIEKWLAAHFASMREQRVGRVAVGESEITYEGRQGMGLKATRYGQQALALDPTSALKADRRYTNTVNGGE